MLIDASFSTFLFLFVIQIKIANSNLHVKGLSLRAPPRTSR